LEKRSKEAKSNGIREIKKNLYTNSTQPLGGLKGIHYPVEGKEFRHREFK